MAEENDRSSNAVDLPAAGVGEDLWREYARGIAELGAILSRASTPKDEVTLAEGYRHLARMLYMGLLATHEYADTDSPEVFLAKTPTQLTGGVTSDAVYHEAFIDGRREYRLWGERGEAPLIEITAPAGKIGITDQGTVVDSLREDRLVLVDGPSGSGAHFEIRLSPDPRPEGYEGNWLQTLDPEVGAATYLLIRQYSTRIVSDRLATFHIEPLEAQPQRRPVSLAEISDGLTDTVAFVDKLVRRWAGITDAILSGAENDFQIVSQPDDLPLPTGHRFATAGFRVHPDEAWVVRIPGIGKPPYSDAPYWGFQLTNYWFEPLDYSKTWAHLNKDSAIYDEDGSVTIVVSEADPGRPNWLQLRGHTVGSAQFRLSRVREALPEITCEVVKLGDTGALGS